MCIKDHGDNVADPVVRRRYKLPTKQGQRGGGVAKAPAKSPVKKTAKVPSAAPTEGATTAAPTGSQNDGSSGSPGTALGAELLALLQSKVGLQPRA